MEEVRQSPEQLLRAISRETPAKQRGNLKIFFGYAAGVGKTYTMLKAAHAAKRRGVDVVAGYIEPHARPKTAVLQKGLEKIPTRSIPHGNITLSEFDLDAALKRKPQIILVDELAHTNDSQSRHTKRYRDVEELLEAGIDVYTTVNVQHIESLNDLVASITGIMVKERIPDSVFDHASQVELVDIEPEELIDRLNNGQFYREEQAARAAANFFTIDNLTALREIALRRCADRVNQLTENARIKSHGDYHTDEHILVCLSPSISNAKIIRTAARMANAFRGTFTALFVETPGFLEVEEEDKKRLRSNIQLARQLGATIETVYGEEPAYQIAEFARLSGVSKIVIGRSTTARRSLWGKPVLAEKLITIAPNADIHIIPDSTVKGVYYKKKVKPGSNILLSLRDIGKSIAILILATLTGLVFAQFGFTEANIITIYILGVLVTSVVTTSRICSLISSIVSVLVFNFFFTVPKFTFQAYDKGYPVTFLIMFIAAFITGSLAAKLKNQAKQTAQAAFRTKVLFDTNQLLQKVHGSVEIITVTANQLTKLLERDLIVYLSENKELGRAHTFSVSGNSVEKACLSENEKAVAHWVLRNNKHAGATTETLSDANCLYLAIRMNHSVYGVVGIVVKEHPLDAFENSVLLSILGECALALENDMNAREKEQTAILAKNEQLRANLLRAISHDLRTPLTSISGNASNLLSNGSVFDEQTKLQIYHDIYDDSMWLINLVENLLSVTRIEEGRMNLKRSAELIEEVIAEALRHVNRNSTKHRITVESSDELLLAKIDAKLIVQVVINIVDNAVKYTPAGSEITITTKKVKDDVILEISDNGPGIPDEVKVHIFDMFYTGANQIADSRRSLGLGLSLCKSIINAHGGELAVSDHIPQGARFTVTLPAGEVKLHE